MQITFSSVAALLATLSMVSASPLDIEKRATCTITSSNLSSISSIKKSCTNIVVNGVTVPAGETLDLTGLKDGTTVTFKGTTSFGHKAWEGPLISVSGNQITVNGASGHVINGGGEKYWDGKGSNGGSKKPKFFYAHKLKKNSIIKGLNVKNTPVQGFSINNSDSLTIDGVHIDNSAGDSKGGHNTDAFDVGSSNNIKIQNVIVKNQDDCLAVNSGTNIYFTNNYCSGGHGISIGSVGGRSDNVVDGVHVSDCHVTNSDNGIRIKTVYKATGKVNNVNYKNIKLDNIHKYGIIVEGDYQNGSPTGTPTSGLPITGLTINGVTGSVDSNAQPVYILVKGASGWKWSGVNITGGKTKKSCTGIPSGSGAKC